MDQRKRKLSVLVLVSSVLTAVAACTATSSGTSDAAAVAPASDGRPAPADPLASLTPAPGAGRRSPDEHPELAQPGQVTVEALTQAITNYVQDESKRQRGTFPVPHPDRGTPVGLTLTTVHRERLSRLADGRFFACADFKTPDGETYDVDIFMRAESSGLVPTDVMVHKVNGTPRFNWSERDGVWSATPIEKR